MPSLGIQARTKPVPSQVLRFRHCLLLQLTRNGELPENGFGIIAESGFGMLSHRWLTFKAGVGFYTPLRTRSSCATTPMLYQYATAAGVMVLMEDNIEKLFITNNCSRLCLSVIFSMPDVLIAVKKNQNGFTQYFRLCLVTVSKYYGHFTPCTLIIIALKPYKKSLQTYEICFIL